MLQSYILVLLVQYFLEYLYLFSNVKQIHELETLRAKKKAAKLNALIQRFITFKEKFGFI